MKTKIKEFLKNKIDGVSRPIFKCLMLQAARKPGRKLFNEEELFLAYKALLSQNLFGVNGQMVPRLEKEFALNYGVPYAVASTSGTAAIHTALGSLDLNPADEVITAPITDMGTIIPILYQNAVPVFADIDGTFNMDPSDVEKKINPRTRAILVVHLFGNPCDMDAMMKIARKHKIPLIEDCSQAHMTEYKGKLVGTIGDIGCFSFQQAKHMTTGDGGISITSNKALYEKMKLFVDKNYARKGWGARAYYSLAPNYRMNELTAAVGIAQLGKVKNVIHKRNELGQLMAQLLSVSANLKPVPTTGGAKHSYWLYPIWLNNINIETFAMEMKKADVKVLAGYTLKPIYLCTEALTAKKTYGTSGCPFTCKNFEKNHEYKEGLCPQAEDSLKHLVCLQMDETWSRKKVEDTANALLSCSERLSGMKAKEPAVIKQTAAAAPVASNNQKKKTKVAIIGCGYIGKWHLEAYQRNPDVELAAFVDTNIERAMEFAKNSRARSYHSYIDMLREEKIDAASICTIPSTHKTIALGLLEAGINVLCEKPLAISSKEAKEMVDYANKKNLLLLPAYKFRFFDEVTKAKELIQNGSMGKIMNFRLMFGGYQDMSGTWFSKKEFSGGGVIIDNGSHALDLARYLFGEVESISAHVKNFQPLEVEDTANLALHFKNGVTGTIDLSWSLGVASPSYLEIYCEEGAIVLDLSGLKYKFRTWHDWRYIPNQLDQKGAFKKQIDHFLQAIESRKPAVIRNIDGLRSQEVIEAAYGSINSFNKENYSREGMEGRFNNVST